MLLAVLWWGGLSALLRSGFVLPAGTAAGQADGLVRALEAGELTPDQWVDFDRLVDNRFAQKAAGQ